ncbi:NAD(P)H-dependent oxidoreductase subunit E [Methylocapsa sp. S129]|uniref:NAD(P)H-dependent oxidoreductase subunit E n=1 Tax=Methylocapsa sp. S129 TaxID=1641869 RepID=UPI00131E727C|nr:NAD(P)H-dependent oxidoreductase subunit E [Methylocapsa sp. S129]
MKGCAPWDAEAAARIIEEHRGRQGAALPILRALQECFGYVDKAAVPMIADALNVSKAEIHGIITFYHDFRAAPVDGDVLKLCRAESCQAMGCEDLVAHLAAEHRIVADQHSPGATLRVETVYCLGNCALSPAALLNGDPVGRLNRSRIDSIVHDASGGA